MTRSNLAKTIKACRVKADISQGKLAAKADIDLRYYQRIEAGENEPSLTILFKIAKALGVSYQEILGPSWEYFLANQVDK
jgi:transcriptional regulator with XRE-family HTH domain